MSRIEESLYSKYDLTESFDDVRDKLFNILGPNDFYLEDDDFRWVLFIKDYGKFNISAEISISKNLDKIEYRVLDGHFPFGTGKKEDTNLYRKLNTLLPSIIKECDAAAIKRIKMHEEHPEKFDESLNEECGKKKLEESFNISSDKIAKAEQCLIDNGIDEDEAEIVLQALGYILLDTELYDEEDIDEPLTEGRNGIKNKE